MQDFAAPQCQWDEDDHNRQARYDGPAQDLVNGGVENCLLLFATPHAEIFPDTIEDDHGIGQRVSRECQQSRHHKERDLLIEQIKGPEHRQHIMKGGKGGRHAETELEPHGDIQDNAGE